MKKLVSFALPMILAVSSCCNSNYSWDADLQHRLACDFTKTREDVKEYIIRYIPDVTEDQIDAWTASGRLEAMEIGGELKYFHNAAPNLFRIDPVCRAIREAAVGPYSKSAEDSIVRVVTDAALESGSALVERHKMKVHYTITVAADAVPAGETIRCWMPFPRKDVARQDGVELISTVPSEHLMSDPSCAHSTVYVEKKAVAGEPTIFEETFVYESSAERHFIDESCVKPYDTGSELYRTFTSEREFHLVFSERMRSLSDSLTSGLDNPYAKVRSIFEWIDARIPWASAREYSTMENIPEYVLANGHGDCGMKTLTFMTLARIAGIPTRWQSGFYMKPDDDNLHDWSEAYFEGIGWVPVDMSFGRCDTMGEDCRFFYLGSIDPWRMVVNVDYGRELSPAKKYPRSETVDFQRGEVEWRGGNVYFDQWRSRREIEYL